MKCKVCETPILVGSLCPKCEKPAGEKTRIARRLTRDRMARLEKEERGEHKRCIVCGVRLLVNKMTKKDGVYYCSRHRP